MKPSSNQETLRRALTALKEARTRLETIERARREPIAIVGMGCRFPGSSNSPEAYWSMLAEGRHGIREVPRDRWPSEHYYDDDPSAPGKMRFSRAGFVDEPDQFDPGFFEISPREASHMDPQQRMLLQVAWEALDDAGVPAEDIRGSATGVWVGVNSNDYLQLQTLDPRNIDTYTIVGGTCSIVANRLSYLLDARGPSLAVDTACSTALVAVHLACQSLRTGECEMAIAGAVNLILSPLMTMAHARGMPMADDHRCKTFDARANGYVRGEGCGVVVLKRLCDAVRDGDEIWATIRGTAVNQDGRTNGLTAPNGLSQQDVIRRALDSAAVQADSVGFIEAHGTGTVLGDPIEVEALQQVYGRSDGGQCVLGSVKTNIGHLESAAGIAGLIKVALSLHHAKIPAVLNFETLNPLIELDQERFTIPTALRDWSDPMRRGAVSSFGAGGTNAHVVLEQAAEAPADSLSSETKPQDSHLILVSARNEDALRNNAAALAQWVDRADAPDLHDVAFTSVYRRSAHEHRLVVDARDPATLAEQLRAFAARDPKGVAVQGRARPGHAHRLAFVCSGHGSQWAGMAHDLMQTQPVFREAIERCHAAISSLTDWSLVDQLRADAPVPTRFDVVQPTLWAVEIALAAQWAAWGVRPDIVVGHSMGEAAAAAICGALSLEDAARVICTRSRLMVPTAGEGSMLLIGRPAAEVASTLERWSGRLSIAVVNSPGTTVVSGESQAIAELEDSLQGDPVFRRQITVDVASHSPRMDPVLAPLARELADIEPQTPHTPMMSTVDLELVDGPRLDAAYWARNVREPVRFGEATRRVLDQGHDVFVELSPHPILGTAIEQTVAHTQASGTQVVVVSSMTREHSGVETMRRAWSGLLASGCPVDREALVPSTGRTLRLPTYRWSNRGYWFVEDRWAPLLAAEATGGAGPQRDALRQASSRLEWVERPAASTHDGASWWVLGDHDGLAAALCQHLEQRGVSAWHTDALPAATDAAWAERSPSLVVDLRTLSAQQAGPAAAARATAATLAALRGLQRVAAASPRLWVVTRGAWSEQAANPVAAAQWGLGRTIAIEQPERFGGSIDLEGDDIVTLARQLAGALSIDDEEDQLRVIEDRVVVPRVASVPQLSLESDGLDGQADGCIVVAGPDCGALRFVLTDLAERGAECLIWLDEGRETAPGGAALPEGVTRVAASMFPAALARHVAQGRAPHVAIRVGAAWDTCTVSELDERRLESAFEQDAAAVETLLHTLEGHALRHIVLMSSVAVSWGSMGMAHVGAAGAYIDALARRCRARGQACTTIEWTPWAAGGMLDEQALASSERMGVEPLDPAFAMAATRVAVASSVWPLAVAAVDWSRLRPAYESRRRRPFLGGLGAEVSPSHADGGLLERLRDTAAEDRSITLADELTHTLAELLQHPADAIESDTGFFALGLDSLMAVELRRRLQLVLACSIPASVVFEHPTIERLTRHLLHDLGLAQGDASQPITSTATPAANDGQWNALLADASAMSEQDLIAALESELE